MHNKLSQCYDFQIVMHFNKIRCKLVSEIRINHFASSQVVPLRIANESKRLGYSVEK